MNPEDGIEMQCISVLKRYLQGNISREEFEETMSEIDASLNQQQRLFEAAA